MRNHHPISILCALSLASTMALPAMAAEPTPVISNDPRMTRGELVAMLHEAAGSPVVNYAMDYSDVSADSENAEAIRWATSQQLVGGYSDGRFGPEDTVTREQLAVILYRMAQDDGMGFTGAWAFPLPYDDAADVSEYAYEAVCWISMQDILDAAEGENFRPDQAVTRDEATAAWTQYGVVAAEHQ